MKAIWCKELEDVVNIARGQGWIFHRNVQGKNYYYVYAGVEAEIICLLVETKDQLRGRYVTIDDDGMLVTSEKPIMPACAKVIEVTKDLSFEELLNQSTVKR
jgi:hypothetical protein